MADRLKHIVMGWLTGLAIIVAVLIVGLLLLPLEVEMDSERQIYQVGVGRLLYFQLAPSNEEWRWGVSVMGWKKSYGFSFAPFRRHAGLAQTTRMRKWKVRPAAAWRKVRRLAKSFRIRRLRVDIDTDDFMLNAYLYPVFRLLNRSGRRLAINFEGRTVVDVFLTNRVWKVLWALMR